MEFYGADDPAIVEGVLDGEEVDVKVLEASSLRLFAANEEFRTIRALLQYPKENSTRCGRCRSGADRPTGDSEGVGDGGEGGCAVISGHSLLRLGDPYAYRRNLTTACSRPALVCRKADVKALIGRDNVKRHSEEALTTRCRLSGCAGRGGQGMFHGHFENARPATISCGPKAKPVHLHICGRAEKQSASLGVTALPFEPLLRPSLDFFARPSLVEYRASNARWDHICSDIARHAVLALFGVFCRQCVLRHVLA